MRRVLVPLDGSDFSEAIFPDARRLAGHDGELVLVREASWPLHPRNIIVDSTMLAAEASESYLEQEAQELRSQGVNVQTQSFMLTDAAAAIDQAVRTFKTDLVAIATHGRSALGRLVYGGVAWRALAHSPVPVLLRHLEDGAPPAIYGDGDCHIMVPLDGSAYAEAALPLARELALEWNASVSLLRVIPDVPIMGTSGAYTTLETYDKDAVPRAHAYLQDVARTFRNGVTVAVQCGQVVNALVDYAENHAVTDVVLASHGRTGLSRVILGSVADGLIHGLHMPVIVVPALVAAQRQAPMAVSRESLHVSLA